jgi:hypothetical protein
MGGELEVFQFTKTAILRRPQNGGLRSPLRTALGEGITHHDVDVVGC